MPGDRGDLFERATGLRQLRRRRVAQTMEGQAQQPGGDRRLAEMVAEIGAAALLWTRGGKRKPAAS